MSEEQDSEITEMEQKLPDGAKLTKPISSKVIEFLNRAEKDESYFDKGTTRKENRDVQRKKLNLYFHAAFYDRSRIYIPLFIFVILLLSVDAYSSVLGWDLQAYGLMLDGLGALIIAAGLFRGISGIKRDTPKTSTGAQFGGTVYYSGKPLSSTVRETVDGVFGSTFLFIGFSIQFFAVTGLSFW